MSWSDDDPEYEDYLHEVGWFVHAPGTGYPRQGHIGEHIYTDEWSKLMRRLERDGLHAPNGKLASILSKLPGRITQRHATICARFSCWLGTNCGMSLVYSARRLMEKNHERGERAFAMQWAIENERSPGLNSGFRLIEWLLAPEDHFGATLFGLGGRGLLKAPDLSVEDYETVEHLMRWFGSEEGLSFIGRAEHRIKEHTRIERIAKRVGATVPAESEK